MRAREFLEDMSGASEEARLSVALGQIASEVKDTNTETPINLQGLLDNLSTNYNLHFDEQQFKAMVVKPPVKNIISRIEGDGVIFVGQRAESNDAVEVGPEMGTIKKMAKRAEKSRS